MEEFEQQAAPKRAKADELESNDELKALPVRFLEDHNKTAFDATIKFFDEGHVYLAWNAYLDAWVSTNDGGLSAPLVSTTVLTGQCFPSPDFAQMARMLFVAPANKIRMATDPGYRYYGCACVEDIQAQWAKGAVLGTLMHANFEDLSNLLEYDRHNPAAGPNTMQRLYAEKRLAGYTEKIYFADACAQMGITGGGDRVIWRTEMLLFHDVLHLAGAIDGMLYNKKEDSYEIWDFKRSKGKLHRDPVPKRSVNKKGIVTYGRVKPAHELAASGRGACYPAAKKMRNNSVNKYGLQLSIYRAFFARMFPEKRMGKAFLVCVDNMRIGQTGALEIIEVDCTRFDKLIEEIFAARANEILAAHQKTLPRQLFKDLIKFLPPVGEVS